MRSLRRPRFKGSARRFRIRPVRRPSHASINRLIPNIITTVALCTGLTAIRYALQERWEAAVMAIVIAGILDALDGRIARILRAQTPFGAQFDSLSDFLCFGVAPALTLFMWSLEGARGLGWFAALALSLCTAFRLARFNTADTAEDRPTWANSYFNGVASPAGAGLAIMPLLLTFQFGPGLENYPYALSIYTIVVAILVISQLPTFSLKALKIPRGYMPAVFAFLGLCIAALISEPWTTLLVVGFLYIGSLPITVIHYYRRHASMGAGAEQTAEAPPIQ